MRSTITASLIAASALALAACTTTEDGDTAGAQSSSSTTASAAADTMTPTPTPMASTGNTTTNPMVGGAEMFPTKNIVENAVNSADHTTLVAAVQAAGLVETLSGPGPFTVFAPTNEAFSRLAPGTVDTLLKPENKPSLTKVLTYHVVPGRISAADLTSRIQAGGGTARLTTVEGSVLTASLEGQAVKLTDVNGNIAYVSQADVFQSNGVIHVVNSVVLPKLG